VSGRNGIINNSETFSNVLIFQKKSQPEDRWAGHAWMKQGSKARNVIESEL